MHVLCASQMTMLHVLLTQVNVKCREFEERYEVDMKIDNKQQKVKLDVEFLPANCLAKNKVEMTIKATSRQ